MKRFHYINMPYKLGLVFFSMFMNELRSCKQYMYK